MTERRLQLQILLGLVALISSIAWAAEPSPIVIRAVNSAELEAPEGVGLIGLWAYSSVNKEQVKKIERFNEWLPDSMLESKARAVFRCAKIGSPDEDCRTEAAMLNTENELQTILKTNQETHGFIVTLQPIMVEEGFSLRVPVQELHWDGKALKPLRTFTILYGTRVPRSLTIKAGATSQQLKEFWLSDSPNRLTKEVEKGLSEVAAMLPVLTANIDTRNEIPKAWRELPKIKTLESTGRARCSGTPCVGVRIYKDTQESLWLTFASDIFFAGRLLPSIGAVMVSLDNDAAQWETNVWGLTFTGY